MPLFGPDTPWNVDHDANGFKLIGIGAGTAAAPSAYFSTDSTSGFYRPAANQLGLSISGAAGMTLAANATLSTRAAMTVQGVGSFNGANSGTVTTNAAWSLLGLTETIHFDTNTVASATYKGVTAAGNIRVNNGAVLTSVLGLNFSPQINTTGVLATTAVAAGSNGVDVSSYAGAGTLNVTANSTTNFLAAGTLIVATSTGNLMAVITYTAKTASTFTGCTTVSGTGLLSTSNPIDQASKITLAVATNCEPFLIASSSDVNTSALYIPDAVGFRYKPQTGGIAGAFIGTSTGVWVESNSAPKAMLSRGLYVADNWSTTGVTAWGLAIGNVQSYHNGALSVGHTNSPATGTKLDISGGLTAQRKATVTLANGANNDVTLPTSSFVTVSGPTGAFSITGIAGGVDGAIVRIVNLTGQNMTMTHQLTSTAANQITSMTGASAATTGNGVAELQYDTGSSKWILTYLTA